MNPMPGQSKNVLNADVEIKGTVKLAGELVFDGKLEGDLQTEAHLALGETAVVNGNLQAATMVARGKINGNITIKDKLEVKTKTEIVGDIRAARLVVEEGVVFVGKAEINPNKLPPTAAPVRSLEPPRPAEPAKPAGR